jgi:hypothetical protein
LNENNAFPLVAVSIGRERFPRDGLEDASFPAAPKSWDAIEGYLLRKRACLEVIEAGRQIWRAYVRDMAQWGDDSSGEVTAHSA